MSHISAIRAGNSVEAVASRRMGEGDILVERRGGVAVVTLNRGRALNALTREMCVEMHGRLADWADDDGVSAVVLRGAEPRAFCAGGDVRAIHDADDPMAFGRAFFTTEYRLNQAIFRFPKPIVSLLQGYVFGGGAGLSMHGSHRVVSDSTVFAMPETALGLFPDVGASDFLPRCPGLFGRYLALTGVRIGGADCLAMELATHYRDEAGMAGLIDELAAAPALDRAIVSRIIGDGVPAEKGKLMAHEATVARCFAAPGVTDVMAALEADEDSDDAAWAAETLAILRAASPTGLEITTRAQAHGATLDFEGKMRMEYRLALYCLGQGDFLEGVRAVLVDRDGQPVWRPSALAEVDGGAIDAVLAADAPDLSFD